MPHEELFQPDQVNVLVAEHIMGWKHNNAVVQDMPWIDPDGDPKNWDDIPEYTGSREEANRVAGRMEARGFIVEIEPMLIGRTTGHRVSMYRHDKKGEAYMTTSYDDGLPYAICVVALKSLGVPCSYIVY
jgi:hypothetical protein